MLALAKRLDRLEQAAQPTGARLTFITCDKVSYWRAGDYRTTIHSIDAAGNACVPEGVEVLTRADVDRLKQRHNIIVIHYVKHEDTNYDNN